MRAPLHLGTVEREVDCIRIQIYGTRWVKLSCCTLIKTLINLINLDSNKSGYTARFCMRFYKTDSVHQELQ